jgi:hypothetical protein
LPEGFDPALLDDAGKEFWRIMIEPDAKYPNGVPDTINEELAAILNHPSAPPAP